MDSVPYARPAIAWAPPTLYISSAPAISAATKMASNIFPSFWGGVTQTTFSTPAIFAGITVISMDEG